MITLVFLSYHSAHHIKRIVKNTDSKYKIIVIENSSDSLLKNEIEKKYTNVNVEVCKENLGFSKGMNLGISLSKTPYVFLNPSDVDISNKVLDSLSNIIKHFDDFAMLSPVYEDRSIHSNFFVWNKKGPDKIINTQDENFTLKEVDFIDGTIIINKKKINNELFDENFFIYFETMDLSKRLIEKKFKLYVCEELKFNHFGGQSHEKKFNFQAQLSRNWHYNWSKFYYFKKNFSYLYALKKFSTVLFKNTLKLLYYFMTRNKENYLLKKAEINGSMHSILLNKSNYRPYKKI